MSDAIYCSTHTHSALLKDKCHWLNERETDVRGPTSLPLAARRMRTEDRRSRSSLVQSTATRRNRRERAPRQICPRVRVEHAKTIITNTTCDEIDIVMVSITTTPPLTLHPRCKDTQTTKD